MTSEQKFQKSQNSRTAKFFEKIKNFFKQKEPERLVVNISSFESILMQRFGLEITKAGKLDKGARTIMYFSGKTYVGFWCNGKGTIFRGD